MTINDLKEQVPILEVLEHFGGRLARWDYGSSDRWVAVVCPFCDDTNGSASVNQGAGRFLCHQCGAPRDGRSGDVIDVAMHGNGITDSRQAIEWLETTFLRR